MFNMILELLIHCSKLNLIPYFRELLIFLGERGLYIFKLCGYLIMFAVVHLGKLSELGLFDVIGNLIHETDVHFPHLLVGFFLTGE